MNTSIIDRLRGWRDHKYARAIFTIVVGVVLALAIELPQGQEHWSADWRTATLSPRLPTQHPKIVLVQITNRTMDETPYVSPIDRRLLAKLIRAIDDAGPTAIGLDLVFDRPTEPAKDAELAQTIRNAKTAVVLGALDDQSLPAQERAFQSAFLAQAGRTVSHLYLDEPAGNPFIISDNVIRKIAEPADRPSRRPSFAHALATLQNAKAVDGGSYISWILTPADNSETFLTLAAEDVGKLTSAAVDLPLAALLRGKFVLVGGNFPDRDQHLTPLSVRSDQRSSGLFIHAQILNQMLEDRRMLAFESWYAQATLMIVFGLLAFILGRTEFARRRHVLFHACSAGFLIVLGVVSFLAFGFILPSAIILIVWMAAAAGAHKSVETDPVSRLIEEQS